MYQIIFKINKQPFDQFFYQSRSNLGIRDVLYYYGMNLMPSKYLLIFELENPIEEINNLIEEFVNSNDNSIQNNVKLLSNIYKINQNLNIYSFNDHLSEYEKFEVPFENLIYILPFTKVEYPLNECKFKFFNYEGKEVAYGEHLNFSFEFYHKDCHPVEVGKIELPTLDYSGDGNPNVTVYKYSFITDKQRENFIEMFSINDKIIKGF